MSGLESSSGFGLVARGDPALRSSGRRGIRVEYDVSNDEPLFVGMLGLLSGQGQQNIICDVRPSKGDGAHPVHRRLHRIDGREASIRRAAACTIRQPLAHVVGQRQVGPDLSRAELLLDAAHDQRGVGPRSAAGVNGVDLQQALSPAIDQAAISGVSGRCCCRTRA